MKKNVLKIRKKWTKDRSDKRQTSKNAEKWHNFWFYGLLSIKRGGSKKWVLQCVHYVGGRFRVRESSHSAMVSLGQCSLHLASCWSLAHLFFSLSRISMSWFIWLQRPKFQSKCKCWRIQALILASSFSTLVRDQSCTSSLMSILRQNAKFA